MAAISETLRQARLRSGIDLERLADKTKINPRYLQAIEVGDFGKLPSGIFARMFVKQYADAVGLDGASFAEEFQRSMSFGQDAGPDVETIAATRTNYHPIIPGMSAVGDRLRNERLASMLSSLIWVVAAILVCAGAYYGLAHLPSRAGSAVPAPGSPKPADTAVAKTPLPTPAVKADTPPAEQPNVLPLQPAAAIQLVIKANGPVWVTATADGKTVVSEILNPGASKSVAATGSARITVGNAGVAEISFNGKKLEPLGTAGQVRTVEFTPQGPQVVSRTSPNADSPRNPDPLR
jgi:hypothetical protein